LVQDAMRERVSKKGPDQVPCAVWHQAPGRNFVHALAFVQTIEKWIVTAAGLPWPVQGEPYQWGLLMAGALRGSIAVALFYSFFVERGVSAKTGAVKE
jgi:ABC-type glycerol-3-phosphate transport system permease component